MRRHHKTLHSILHSVDEDEEGLSSQALLSKKSAGDSVNSIDCTTQKEHLSYASLLNTTVLHQSQVIPQDSLELLSISRKNQIKHENRCTKYMTYSFEHISKEPTVQRPLKSSVSCNPIYNLNSYANDFHPPSDLAR